MKKILLSIKQWLLLCILLFLALGFIYLRLYEYLSIETIKLYHSSAREWTHQHYESAVCLYVLIYIAIIACAIPGATLLALVGGFLFGGIAVIYAVFGTTMGGTILFLAVRTAIGTRITTRTTGWIKKMEAGFQQNAFHYLLMLRLVPVFPCWVSNIAAGALNVHIRTFLSATVLGIFPATFIYVMVGRGLDRFLTEEHLPYSTLIFTPSCFLPLLGLAILSLFPVFYKSVKKNQNR